MGTEFLSGAIKMFWNETVIVVIVARFGNIIIKTTTLKCMLLKHEFYDIRIIF